VGSRAGPQAESSRDPGRAARSRSRRARPGPGGCSAGLNLNVDRVGITYRNGPSLGDPSSPVRVSSRIAQGRPIPARAIPEVAGRIGLDLDPIDVTDADAARWLRACLPPDEPERTARLDAEMTLAKTALPLLLTGDVVELLPDAIARVPADALPVVISTWAMSQFPIETGDRPASGHSIVGLALFGQSAQPAEAIGRCWSRGRVLAWLADSS
jgi:hypothetical protein